MKELLSGILLFSVIGTASVWAAGNDELWKITTMTEMPGMPMPAVTQTVCFPKGAGYKPGNIPHQKRCEVTDLKVSGNKTSWKVNCPGRDPMKGSGEVTRTANNMKGTVQLSSGEIQMTQAISGKRVATCQAK